MTHEQVRAEVTALFELGQVTLPREQLRVHLGGCGDCRHLYDQTALAMRQLLGRPDQMCPEELYLFEPPLPPAKVTRLFRPAPAIAVALAASLAAVVVWVAVKDDGYQVRGGAAVAEAPGLRVLCSHDGQIAATCVEGDKLLFAVTPRGRTTVALWVDGEEIGSTPVDAQGADVALPFAARWKSGARVRAVFSDGLEVVTVAP